MNEHLNNIFQKYQCGFGEGHSVGYRQVPTIEKIKKIRDEKRDLFSYSNWYI